MSGGTWSHAHPGPSSQPPLHVDVGILSCLGCPLPTALFHASKISSRVRGLELVRTHQVPITLRGLQLCTIVRPDLSPVLRVLLVHLYLDRSAMSFLSSKGRPRTAIVSSERLNLLSMNVSYDSLRQCLFDYSLSCELGIIPRTHFITKKQLRASHTVMIRVLSYGGSSERYSGRLQYLQGPPSFLVTPLVLLQQFRSRIAEITLDCPVCL